MCQYQQQQIQILSAGRFKAVTEETYRHSCSYLNIYDVPNDSFLYIHRIEKNNSIWKIY